MRARFLPLGHVEARLDYWENCGSLGRKLMEGVVMLVHCSFFASYRIIVYAHTCWALLVRAFYFAARQIKEQYFLREA